MDILKKLSTGFDLPFWDADEILIKKNKNIIQVKALGYKDEASFIAGKDSAMEHHLEFALDVKSGDVQKALIIILAQIPDKLDRELNPEKFPEVAQDAIIDVGK